MLESEGAFSEFDMVLFSFLDISEKRELGRLVRFYQFLGFMLCTDVQWDEEISVIFARDLQLMVSDFGSFQRKIARKIKIATANDPSPSPSTMQKRTPQEQGTKRKSMFQHGMAPAAVALPASTFAWKLTQMSGSLA